MMARNPSGLSSTLKFLRTSAYLWFKSDSTNNQEHPLLPAEGHISFHGKVWVTCTGSIFRMPAEDQCYITGSSSTSRIPGFTRTPEGHHWPSRKIMREGGGTPRRRACATLEGIWRGGGLTRNIVITSDRRPQALPTLVLEGSF